MRSFQKLQWLVVLGLLIGLVGCSSGDGGLTTPANVTVGDASPANFWVGRGSDKLGIFVEEGGTAFQAQIPEGSYMLEYSVKDGGSFYIVFTAEEDGASLAVGLTEGAVLDDILIHEGDIANTDLEPEIVNGGVKIYMWPGSTITTQMWTEVFMINPMVAVIVLVLDGEPNTDAMSTDGTTTDGTDGVEVVALEQETCERTVEISVSDDTKGATNPAGTIKRPCNSSLSVTIQVTDGDFIPDPLADATVKDVFLNGVSVLNQVQILGNGNGHLVIHKIDKDIEMMVEFM